MKIKQKFECIDGYFDTDEGELLCIRDRRYGLVELCFKAPERDDGFMGMHIPFAQIKLYSGNRLVDAKEVFDDAVALGEEICRRWNAAKDEP